MTSTDTSTRTAYRSEVDGLTLSHDAAPIVLGDFLPEDTAPEKLEELLQSGSITAIPLRQVTPTVWAPDSVVREQ